MNILLKYKEENLKEFIIVSSFYRMIGNCVVGMEIDEETQKKYPPDKDKFKLCFILDSKGEDAIKNLINYQYNKKYIEENEKEGLLELFDIFVENNLAVHEYTCRKLPFRQEDIFNEAKEAFENTKKSLSDLKKKYEDNSYISEKVKCVELYSTLMIGLARGYFLPEESKDNFDEIYQFVSEKPRYWIILHEKFKCCSMAEWYHEGYERYIRATNVNDCGDFVKRIGKYMPNSMKSDIYTLMGRQFSDVKNGEDFSSQVYYQAAVKLDENNIIAISMLDLMFDKSYDLGIWGNYKTYMVYNLERKFEKGLIEPYQLRYYIRQLRKLYNNLFDSQCDYNFMKEFMEMALKCENLELDNMAFIKEFYGEKAPVIVDETNKFLHKFKGQFSQIRRQYDTACSFIEMEKEEKEKRKREREREKEKER